MASQAFVANRAGRASERLRTGRGRLSTPFSDVRGSLARGLQRRLLWGGLLLLVGLAAPAQAGPVDPERLPATTTWLVHLDMGRLADSSLGNAMQQAIKGRRSHNARHASELQDFLNERFEVDPFKDVRSFTLLGTDEGANRVIMLVEVRGTVASVLDYIAGQGSHQTIEHKDHTIHTWVGRDDDAHQPKGKDAGDEKDRKNDRRGEDHEQRYLARLEADDDGSLLIMADRAEAVARIIDVIEGDAPNMDDVDEGLLEDDDAYEDAVFFTAARNLHRIPGPMRHSHVAQAAEQVTFSIQLDDRAVAGTLAMRTANEKKAGQVKDLAEGMVALARMKAERVEDQPILDVADGAVVEQDDAVVRISAQTETAHVINLLQRSPRKKKHHKHRNDRDKDHQQRDDHRHDRSRDDGKR